MHARVTVFNALKGKGDEAAAYFQNTLVPTAKAQGAKGALLLGKTDLGKAIHVVIWDSEDAMMDAENEGQFEQQLGEMQQKFLCGPPMLEAFQVFAQT